VETREWHNWLTVPEAAEELRIPRTRCYELIAAGELPAVRIGERSIRVNRQELERFLLESRRVVGTDKSHSKAMRLSPAHKRMLFEESALGARVAVKRGYRTVTRKAELERLGFGRSQRNVPALLVPIYGPIGEISLYQSRPDEPELASGANR